MDKQEITSYIAQHSAWKTRLKKAIESGNHSWDVHQIRRDDQCDFGKWLRSLPATDRSNKHCRNVETIHADFHQQAAHVLELVSSGKRDEAQKEIDLRGTFTTTSAKLTHEMTQWRESL